MVTNTYKRGPRGRQPAVLGRPLVDPAGWHAEELGHDEFVYQLNDTEIGEIVDAVGRIEDRGIALKDVTRADFRII